MGRSLLLGNGRSLASALSSKGAFPSTGTTSVSPLVCSFSAKSFLKNRSVSELTRQLFPFQGMRLPEADVSCSDSPKLKAAKGVRLHADIARAIKGEPPLVSGDFELSAEMDQLQRFLAEVGAHFQTIVAIEGAVASKVYGISGRVDLVVLRKDGTYALYDFKLSKFPYDYSGYHSTIALPLGDDEKTRDLCHCIQLNAYKALVEETHNIEIAEMYIVRCHAGLPSYQLIRVPDCPDLMRCLFEAKS